MSNPAPAILAGNAAEAAVVETLREMPEATPQEVIEADTTAAVERIEAEGVVVTELAEIQADAAVAIAEAQAEGNAEWRDALALVLGRLERLETILAELLSRSIPPPSEPDPTPEPSRSIEPTAEAVEVEASAAPEAAAEEPSPQRRAHARLIR